MVVLESGGEICLEKKTAEPLSDRSDAIQGASFQLTLRIRRDQRPTGTPTETENIPLRGVSGGLHRETCQATDAAPEAQ